MKILQILTTNEIFRYEVFRFEILNSNDIEAELTPGLWWITPRVEIMNLVKEVTLKIILFCQQFLSNPSTIFTLLVTFRHHCILYFSQTVTEPPWSP